MEGLFTLVPLGQRGAEPGEAQEIGFLLEGRKWERGRNMFISQVQLPSI